MAFGSRLVHLKVLTMLCRLEGHLVRAAGVADAARRHLQPAIRTMPQVVSSPRFNPNQSHAVQVVPFDVHMSAQEQQQLGEAEPPSKRIRVGA